MKTTLNTIKIIVIALLIAVGASYASAAWQGAPSTPPDNNVLPLINTSTQTQTKQGGILSGLTMKSPEFCLIDPVTLAEKCVTFGNSWGSGGSGGGGAQGSLCGLHVNRAPENEFGRLRVSCQGHDPRVSCPSGYEQVIANHAGFGGQAIAEWYMCASTSSGSGSGGTQLLPGWPNEIVCSANGVMLILELQAKGWAQEYDSSERKNLVTYTTSATEGSKVQVVYKYDTKQKLATQNEGTYGDDIIPAVRACPNSL